MNGLTNATRTLIRSIVIAAAVAALAFSATRPAEASQDYDPTVAANVQRSMCQAGGGTAEVSVSRKPSGAAVMVKCKGGILDGWTCVYVADMTVCTEPSSHPGDLPDLAPTGGVEVEPGLPDLTANVAAHVAAPTDGIETEPEPTVPTTEVADEVVAPTGGVEVVEDGSQPMLASTDDVVAPVEGAEEPVAGEPTVLSQSVDLAALGTYQAALCEAGGGTATVETVRTGNGLLAVRVVCTGGTLDGWTCTNVQGLTDCYFAGKQSEPTSPVTDNAVEPTGGVEVEPELSVLTANVAAHVDAPTGGVEVAADEPLPAPATTDDVVAPVEGAEEPVAEEQAAASQTYDPTVAANAAISMCEVAGGTAVVDVVRKADGVDLVRVRCVGGTLDGWDCFFDKSGTTICDGLLPNPGESPAVAPTGGVETEPEPTVPTTEVADDVVVPTEVAEEPEVEDDAGQNLPDNPTQDESTAPTGGDPVADPGAGAGDEGAVETHVLAGQNGGIVFYEVDDEQS